MSKEGQTANCDGVGRCTTGGRPEISNPDRLGHRRQPYLVYAINTGTDTLITKKLGLFLANTCVSAQARVVCECMCVCKWLSLHIRAHT